MDSRVDRQVKMISINDNAMSLSICNCNDAMSSFMALSNDAVGLTVRLPLYTERGSMYLTQRHKK